MVGVLVGLGWVGCRWGAEEPLTAAEPAIDVTPPSAPPPRDGTLSVTHPQVIQVIRHLRVAGLEAGTTYAELERAFPGGLEVRVPDPESVLGYPGKPYGWTPETHPYVYVTASRATWVGWKEATLSFERVDVVGNATVPVTLGGAPLDDRTTVPEVLAALKSIPPGVTLAGGYPLEPRHAEGVELIRVVSWEWDGALKFHFRDGRLVEVEVWEDDT